MIVESQSVAEPASAELRTSRVPHRAPADAKESAAETSDAIKFLAIVAQLTLLAGVIYRFNLESPAFVQLTVLAFAGFVVHYFLPLAYRLPFFAALSLAGTVMVLGVTESAWLFAIGVALIGMCHLPGPLWIRVALLAGVGVLLALMRGGVVTSFVPMAIWPILGSVFVFRLVVYLYDLHFHTAPTSVTRSLSYFFMLPNVCFPLYPVVDYQSFCRNYYDDDRFKIYQVGVRWIFRGCVHLILYRILYKNWSISLYEVENAGDLAHYSLWLFLLYLRVSGQFHVIVGMLHLFGFNLAETHHLYYLSSSFTDFWRRINIYWKDFMMKIFFYPVYFRIKHWGPMAALVASTLVVFVLTWLLHAVQWFWLRGSFLWAANDILFWSILAGLVVVNSLWEAKRGRKRNALGKMSWPAALVVGLKTLATFTVICGLWSLWTSESISAWWTLRQFIFTAPSAAGWALIIGTVVAIVGSAMLLARNPNGFSWSELSFIPESAVRVVLMLALIAASTTFFRIHGGPLGELIASAKTGNLNQMEMAQMERGYYENLLDVNRFNGELWNLYSQRPIECTTNSIDAGIARKTDNFVRVELIPSVEAKYRGVMVKTNRWGMHDEECEQKRPAGCYRIVLLGDSHVMATGVQRNEDFESLVESRLNRENKGGPYTSFEILNFAFEGYAPNLQVWVLEHKAMALDPNAVFLVGHPDDAKRAVYHLVQLIREGIEPAYPEVRAIMERAGVNKDTPEPVVRRKLAPFGEELMSWSLGRIVQICHEHGIRPVYVLVPEVTIATDGLVECRRAEKAGFTVLNLADVYAGRPRKELYLSAWDTHPNVRGHQLLADRFYGLIREKQIVPLGSESASK